MQDVTLRFIIESHLCWQRPQFGIDLAQRSLVHPCMMSKYKTRCETNGQPDYTVKLSNEYAGFYAAYMV